MEHKGISYSIYDIELDSVNIVMLVDFNRHHLKYRSREQRRFIVIHEKIFTKHLRIKK
jgi:hypothetical protein